MLLNYGAGEFPWTARKSNQSILKEMNPEGLLLKLKLQSLATWCKEPTHWKRLWCWGRLKAGEGEDRGWDSWMASPTQWTWVWASSRRWWRTGKPGMLKSMGSLRVWHDWTKTTKHCVQSIPLIGVPRGSDGKESACNAGDPGLNPGSGRPPEKGNGNTLQYFSLEEFHGQRNLAGYSSWGRKESGNTERLTLRLFTPLSNVTALNLHS